MDHDYKALDWIERRAFADLVAAQTPSHRNELGLAAEALTGDGGALALRSDRLPSLLFNRVIGLGVGRPASESELGAALEAYRQPYFVHLSPHAQPGDRLVTWLRRAGLRPYRRAWNKLARTADGPLPLAHTSLRVRLAEQHDARALGAVLAQAFDIPPEHHALFGALVGRPRWNVYVAVDGAFVAAAGLLYVERDVGYLAGGATHPSYRCRGAQLALMSARVRRALELGCRLVVSETGEPAPGDPQHSHRNMQRCGLVVHERRENWTHATTLWDHGTRDHSRA